MANPGIDQSRIDPTFLQNLTDPIADVYERISHELIVKIAARFNIGGLPKRLIPYSHSWNVYMLQQIGGLTEESYRLMAEEAGNIGELIDIAIRRSCEVSLGAIEPELQRAIQAPGYVPKVSDTVERVVNNYENQALNRCNLVNTVMLNSSLNYYQDIVRDAAHDARVHLRQAEFRTQGRDHPILPAAPETQYLKCGIYQVF